MDHVYSLNLDRFGLRDRWFGPSGTLRMLSPFLAMFTIGAWQMVIYVCPFSESLNIEAFVASQYCNCTIAQLIAFTTPINLAKYDRLHSHRTANNNLTPRPLPQIPRFEQHPPLLPRPYSARAQIPVHTKILTLAYSHGLKDDISHACEALILNRTSRPRIIAPLGPHTPSRARIYAEHVKIKCIPKRPLHYEPTKYKRFIEGAAAPSDMPSSRSRLRRFFKLMRYEEGALFRT